MSSGISKIAPVQPPLCPEDESKECNFTKLPVELTLKIVNYLPSLSDRAKVAGVSRFFEPLGHDNISWRLLCEAIDNEASVKDYSSAKEHILEIYDESKKLGIPFGSSEITVEKAKALKKEVDSIKLRDTVKVWKAIQTKVLADGLTIDFPNFDELCKKNCNEVLEAFNTWTTTNKEKITITELNLSAQSLIYLNESICKLDRLQKLNLSFNKLRSIPDSTGNLTNLTELHLSDNKVQSIPDSIGNLTNLKTLIWNNNQLESIPDIIGKLDQLETLTLVNNKFQIFPVQILNLTNLKTLHLGKNELQSIPNTIGNVLSQLTYLNFETNQLKTIPDSIGNLAQLSYLNLITNKELQPLPSSIDRIKEHCTIYLE